MDVERAARLTALLQHPAWPELVAAIEEKRVAYLDGVMRTLMATGTLPEDFEYKRGFFAGMRSVVRQPDVGKQVLERLAEEQNV